MRGCMILLRKKTKYGSISISISSYSFDLILFELHDDDDAVAEAIGSVFHAVNKPR